MNINDKQTRLQFLALSREYKTMAPLMMHDYIVRRINDGISEAEDEMALTSLNAILERGREETCPDPVDRKRIDAWLSNITSTPALREICLDMAGLSYWGNKEHSHAIDTIDSAMNNTKYLMEDVKIRGGLFELAVELGANAIDVVEIDQIGFVSGFCAAKRSDMDIAQVAEYKHVMEDGDNNPEHPNMSILRGSSMERLSVLRGANDQKMIGGDPQSFAHGFCTALVSEMNSDELATYEDGLKEIKAAKLSEITRLFHNARYKAADLVYENAELGEVSGAQGWEFLSCTNTLERNVYVETEDNESSERKRFVVRFHPDSEIVEGAYLSGVEIDINIDDEADNDMSQGI